MGQDAVVSVRPITEGYLLQSCRWPSRSACALAGVDGELVGAHPREP